MMIEEVEKIYPIRMRLNELGENGDELPATLVTRVHVSEMVADKDERFHDISFYGKSITSINQRFHDLNPETRKIAFEVAASCESYEIKDDYDFGDIVEDALILNCYTKYEIEDILTGHNTMSRLKDYFNFLLDIMYETTLIPDDPIVGWQRNDVPIFCKIKDRYGFH